MKLSKANISNIWTRIYYEQNTMNYEISIELTNGETIVHSTYVDYQKYRNVLKEIVTAKDNGELIELPSKGQRA